MNLLWTALVLVLVFPGAVQASPMETQGIYGSDDRSEVCDQTDSNIRALASTTLAMVPSKMLKEDEQGNFTLSPKKFGEKEKLCKTEAFWDQPIVADCSGFLVGEDLVVTAGHCISKTACGKDLWVFNYQMKPGDAKPSTFDRQDVYKCQELIAKEQTATVDYALFRIDRKVRGGLVANLRKNSEPAVGEDLFVIGYPMGLPAKIAGNAKVRKWGAQNKYFVTNLDTYGGNSGSPVFNARTLEVEGILVRGDVDFISKGSCKVSKQCKDTACDGEEVTNINYIRELLATNAR